MISKPSLIRCLEAGKIVRIVFQSLNSGDLIDIICSSPKHIRAHNIDSNKLVVWRHDEERFEDIIWSSIRHWNL